MAIEPQSRPSFTPRRKWGIGLNLTVRTLVVLAIVVMVNHLASVFFHRQYLSEATKVELSARTRSVLASVTNDVKVTIYYDRDDEFYPTIVALLREYAAINPKIRVETVDYLRDAAEALRIKKLYELPETAKAEEKNYVIFEAAGQKGRPIPGVLLTDTQIEIAQDRKSYRRRATAFKGETVFTAMLRTITNPKQYKAYVLQGHGEHKFDSGDEVTGYLDFLSLLRQNAVEAEPLKLTGTNVVPADCSLLIIAGPQTKISQPEVEKIEQYLAGGGPLFALFNFSSPDSALNQMLLEQWGVAVSAGVVTDPDHSMNSIKGAAGSDVTVYTFSDHPVAKSMQNYTLNLLSPRVVGERKSRETGADAPIVRWLFATEPTAKLINDPAIPPRVYPLAVAVEKQAVPGVVTGRGNTRMIIVGDSYFLANGPMKVAENREFAGYALNWLLKQPQFTEGIGPKSFTEFRLTLTVAQMQTLGWALLGAIPGGILLFGGLVWWRRRK
ncbi:MAG: Gldg family protein [Verrucomicrobiota bacterium]